MADDPTRWQTAVTAVETDVRAWRRAQPEATLTKIEAALDARLNTARAGLLGDVPVDAPEDPERCPDRGARLVRRGERTRTLRTQGDAPLEVTRPYPSCPARGAGLFPPR